MAATPATAGDRSSTSAAAADGDSDETPVSVSAPELERQAFDSWDDLNAHVGSYSERTHQLYVIKTSTPAATRNARLARQPYTQRNQYVPEHFGTYARTYTCTHAGVARNRSTGARPGTSSRCMGCPARFNACVQRTKNHKWKVCVTKHHAVHNHAVGGAVFAQYPEQRRVTDPRVLHTVDVLRKVGVAPAKIRAYIHADSSARPTLEDVYNLLARQRRDDEEERAATDARDENDEARQHDAADEEEEGEAAEAEEQAGGEADADDATP